MIHWGYLVAAFFGGFVFGWFLLALMVTSRDARDYTTGYHHGHQAGFDDGVKSIGGVG